MRHTGLFEHRALPSQAAATLTLLLASCALAGWGLGIKSLTSLISGAVEMKANTALALIFCGIALLIFANRSTVLLQRLARGLSVVVMVVGVVTLAEYFLGSEFGIDEWIVTDRSDAYNVLRGRMSPFSATAFIAIAASLAALPYRRVDGIAKFGAALGTIIGVIALLGYVWDAGELVTDRWLPPVAVNSAASFALLGAGILLLPRRSASGLATRFATLAAVEIQILTGFIVAFVMLLVGGSYTYRANARFAESVQGVAQTQEVRAALASIYGSLAGAEVALRDYVLSEDDAYRDEYQRLTADVERRLHDLSALMGGNTEQRRQVAALQQLASARLAAMQNALDAYDEFGLPAARAMLGLTRSSNSTQSVRAQIERMDAAETRSLAERQESTASVRAMTLVSLLATLGVASALFNALFREIHKEMRARGEAEHAIRDLNSALEAKAAQLQSTNSELESFSYSVSHDLRAPLRAIDGFALMIEEDCKDRLDAEGRRYVAVIRENSKRMGTLIDDLLAFSRLGRLPMVAQPINVAALVREVVDEALNAHSQGPMAQIDIGPLPSADGDRNLLRQVWANLIANAIKYTGTTPAPRIQVSGHENGAEILYSVADNGVGFNMDYVDKLFQVFQRLHRADEFGGTGVGLAIVHRVVTRHGGRVWAKGQLNEGAVFSFALPKRSP